MNRKVSVVDVIVRLFVFVIVCVAIFSAMKPGLLEAWSTNYTVGVRTYATDDGAVDRLYTPPRGLKPAAVVIKNAGTNAAKVYPSASFNLTNTAYYAAGGSNLWNKAMHLDAGDELVLPGLVDPLTVRSYGVTNFFKVWSYGE